MGTTLDSITLNVMKWQEGTITESSQWDAWNKAAGESKRKVKVYTIIRTYTIDCIEKGVNWNGSVAQHFEAVAESGVPVTLFSDLGARPVSSVPVYVLDVAYTNENMGANNIRHITLTLQEAQN